MAGSDRVIDPNDSSEPKVGNAQTNYESAMALCYQCIQKCSQNVLDTADIVRDGDFSPVTHCLSRVWKPKAAKTTGIKTPILARPI